MLKKATRIIWMSIAFLIIAFAFVVSVARLFFPLLEQYRKDAELWATQEFGRPVKFSSISADWYGLQPRLRIKGVQVFTPVGGRTWMEFEEVQVHVQLVGSFLKWRVRIGQLNAVGAKIQVEHDNGQYFIGGLPVEVKQSMGQSRLLNFLIDREIISFSKTQILLKDPRLSSQLLDLRNINLLLSLRDKDYHLSGSFRLQQQLESRFNFIINSSGDFNKFDQMKHKVYFSGNVRLGQWINKRLLGDTDVTAGSIDFRLWAEGIARLERLYGDIDFDDMHWVRETVTVSDGSKQAKAQPFSLERLSGNFSWNRKPDGWQMIVNNLQSTRDGLSWPASKVYLDYQATQTQQVLKGRIGFIRIEDIGRAILANVPLDTALRQKIASLNPVGDIQNFEFDVKNPLSANPEYFIKADLAGIGLNTWEKFPGVRHWGGTLAANNHGGTLKLNSKNAQFDLSRLFSVPLKGMSLQGHIRWAQLASGVEITGNDIIVENTHVRTKSALAVKFVPGAAAPYVNLHVDFEQGIVNAAPNYFPDRIMSPKLVTWLSQALRNGHIQRGTMVYQGMTNEFPFDKGNGLFDVSFDVKGVDLQYHQKWPVIHNIDATVRFFARSLTIQAHSGKIYDLELLPTRVGITTLDRSAHLKIDGAGVGPLADILRYMGEIPTASGESSAVTQFQGAGHGLMHVSLTLPLADMATRSFAGTVELFDASIKHRSLPFVMRNLDGKLSYSSQGELLAVNSEGLTATYESKPAAIIVKSESSDGSSSMNTTVSLTQRTSVKLLFGDYGQHVADWLDGVSDWNVKLNVTQLKSEKLKLNLSIESELQGTQVKLPGVFAKSKNESRTFSMGLNLSNSKTGLVELRYGDLLRALVATKNDSHDFRVERGEFAFGGGEPELPKQAALKIKGKLAQLSVSKWQQWAALGQVKSSAILSQITHLNISIDALELAGNQLQQVQIQALRKPHYWDAIIQAKEIAGKVRVPLTVSKDNPFVADLERLAIVEKDDDRKKPLFDPRNMPPLRIYSKALFYNDSYFGALNLIANRRVDGLHFDKFTLESKSFNLSATGDWQIDKQMQLSKFAISATSDNVGRAMRDQNYGVNFEGGKAKVSINALWFGPPHWFKLKSAKGNMDVEIFNGRIVDLKASSGKLFGMLSLDALPRRLALDFRDVYKKGLTFDRINGQFSIDKGDGFTQNLTIDSPSLGMTIKGRIGFEHQDYDQTITVIPKLTSNLPLVGGIAGGPAVGVGLWVADKMFGKKINRIGTVEYSLEGTWSKPIIKKVRGILPPTS